MSKKGCGKLLAGLGLGTLLGIMIAPKSGEETRKDMKIASKKAVNKIKSIDLDELKDSLINDFENLKNELKDMDADKAKAIAKKKGDAILKKAEQLLDMAKEKGKPMYEKTAKDIKKKLSEILADASKKLDA